MARPTKKEQRERALKQVPRRMLYPINEVRILLCCGNEFLQQLFNEGRLPYVHLWENFHRFFLRVASLAGLSSPEKGLDLKIFFPISFSL